MTTTDHLDILYISESPLWPLDQGYRVHGCQSARALAQQGVKVGMASLRYTSGDVPDWLRQMLIPWPAVSRQMEQTFLQGWAGRGSRWRHRVAKHQAIDYRELAGVLQLVEQHQPKVVIGLGQHAPMMLHAVRQLFPQVRCIWYAADEPILFQLSCLRRQWAGELSARLRRVMVYGLIHTLFARGLHGVIGVSDTDTRWLRRFTGIRHAVTIRNGVDVQAFHPTSRSRLPDTLVFWGRMDFEPNVDAVCWFARHVWPQLMKKSPRARWYIIGKNPSPQVLALGRQPGIIVTGGVDELCRKVRRFAAVVLPMRCGLGIKNKLLEAAAMGLPIVASPHAMHGLSSSPGVFRSLLPSRKAMSPNATSTPTSDQATGYVPPPVQTCSTAGQWVRAVWTLWRKPAVADWMSYCTRAWAVQHACWSATACGILRLANDLLPEERRIVPPETPKEPKLTRPDAARSQPLRHAA